MLNLEQTAAGAGSYLIAPPNTHTQPPPSAHRTLHAHLPPGRAGGAGAAAAEAAAAARAGAARAAAAAPRAAAAAPRATAARGGDGVSRSAGRGGTRHYAAA